MLFSRRLIALVGGVLLTLLLVFLWSVDKSRANVLTPWLAPASLTVQKQSDLTAAAYSVNGNIDCFPEKNGTCSVSTPYGFANTAGAVTLGGSNDYHPVVSNIDNRQHFISIPNSDEFITYTTDPAIGSYLYFNFNFLSSVKLQDQGLGPYYQVSRPPEAVLSDKAGHKLPGDFQSASFSENGEWMIISDPNVAMLRVNLRTFEVLPFAPGFNYSIGLSPDVKTAVSNDGRYAAVASKNYSRFSIYDLDSCSNIPTAINGPASCSSRGLYELMNQAIPGFTAVSNIRFIGDDLFNFNAGFRQDNANKTAKYLLMSGSETINQQDYLALGDSYISGEGAYKYLPGTDTDDNQCHVSQLSYPLQLGRELDFSTYHSVACSGATTRDVTDNSNGYTGQTVLRVQRNKRDVPAIISNFQPGYIDQMDFVKQYQPKVLTISVGGNDIGFSARLRQCLGLGSCYSSYEDRLEFVREVNRAFPKLVNTYSKIKDKGAGNARIYIVGYPQIAKTDGDCAVNVHMNHDELVFAQQAIDYLDKVVKAAAGRAGVFYVDTQDALDGHRLCEARAGSVAVNGITAGNDFPDKLGGPIGRESYHPNEFGHLLLDNSIRAATHNLTDPMPSPDLSANPPDETELEILDSLKSGRGVIQTEYDSDIATDLVYSQSPTEISINADNHALPPNTILTAEVHSNPTSLGSFTTGSDGKIDSQITIPAGVPFGFHTLHFYGNDVNGQPIDVFKDIYVAPSPDDLDGDGVLDDQQACIGVAPANQDFDKDGVDDSCDGVISLPPAGPGQPAAITATISSTSPNLIAFTSSSSPANNLISQVSFHSQADKSQPKVLAASTSTPYKHADHNLRLPTNLVFYIFGALLLLSFALSLV